MGRWKDELEKQREKKMIEDFLNQGYSNHSSSNQVNNTSYKSKRRDYTSPSSSSKNTSRVGPKFDRTGNLLNADELSWQAYLDEQEDDYDY